MKNNSEEMLKKLKLSIGIIRSKDTSLDEFYKQKIEEAEADYLSEDIDEKVLISEFGQNAVVFYAKLLIENADITTNPTIIFLKNKLSILTKGERVEQND